MAPISVVGGFYIMGSNGIEHLLTQLPHHSIRTSIIVYTYTTALFYYHPLKVLRIICHHVSPNVQRQDRINHRNQWLHSLKDWP